MGKIMKEFKEFAVKGNVVDMAVGVIIGGAFGKIVTSAVNDIFMPIISIFVGKVDFSNLFIALDGNKYNTVAEAQEAGVGVFNYGNFIQTAFDFLLLALIVFFMVKLINKAAKKDKVEEAPAAPAPAPHLCPFCKTEISPEATRCPHCTSVLSE